MSRRAIANRLGLGLLFGLAYSQPPLYTSNQNQYFLHGLARAGVGFLAEDWLAGTADPTPLFSGLVAFTSRGLPAEAFYLYFLLLAALYFDSLRSIVGRLFGLEPGSPPAAVFAGLLFASHSAAMRLALGRGLGGAWEHAFDGGIAGQRLLGEVLQPSAFGVLLLWSVHQHLEGRDRRALIGAALAASLHPTYLIPAGALVAAYGWRKIRDGHGMGAAVRLGALALALVTPILIYVGSAFLPASSEARRILVSFRLPSHAVPAEWLDLSVLAKLAWIGLALVAVRRTRLAGAMAVGLGIGTALTLLQIATGSNALALAFPWRISTLLVPLASAVLLGAAARWSAPRLPDRLLIALSRGAIAAAVASGVAASALQAAARNAAPERPVLEFVRSTSRPGQVYLIPPRMQDFRLVTGLPIVADFKSIPYRGEEVLEWYERNRLLGFFYRDQLADIDCALLDEFVQRYQATHLVLEPDQRGLACEGMVLVYDDRAYSVFELERLR